MERYRTTQPRTAFALAAAFAASATLVLAVLPTRAAVQPDARLATHAPTEVAIVPSHIEVIGARTQAAARNDVGSGPRASEHRG